MSDLRDDELRDFLRRRADQVPPHREVPRSLTGRARRRVALNALGAGLAVVVLAGGAFAGVRAFRTAPGHQLGGNRNPTSTPSVQHTPPPSTISACTPAQLRAVGSMQGAAGSLEGGVTVSNFSDTACTLQGTPAITLLDGNLLPSTSGLSFTFASTAGH